MNTGSKLNIVPKNEKVNECQSSLDTIYAGWCRYQEMLIAALETLSIEQLALRPAPHLRSIGEIAAHIIAARARWFAPPLGDGSQELEAFTTWDQPGNSIQSTHELVRALQFTQDFIQITMACWTPAEWKVAIPSEDDHDPPVITRQWIIWHLIEHDLHHGGEISITLGMYGLEPPDL